MYGMHIKGFFILYAKSQTSDISIPNLNMWISTKLNPYELAGSYWSPSFDIFSLKK